MNLDLTDEKKDIIKTARESAEGELAPIAAIRGDGRFEKTNIRKPVGGKEKPCDSFLVSQEPSDRSMESGC